jgi:hypothetical protein
MYCFTLYITCSKHACFTVLVAFHLSCLPIDLHCKLLSIHPSIYCFNLLIDSSCGSWFHIYFSIFLAWYILYYSDLRFHIITMIGTFFPPVVCRMAHILFTLSVFVCVEWCPTHIVLCFFLSSSSVHYIASFSGLSIFVVPSVFSSIYNERPDRYNELTNES